jgi:carbon monoxide dehydrogenase subunit G
MILRNEFTVSRELDAVWRRLLDLEGVASCLPGATIRATDEESTYDGTMRVRMGPMTVEYKGTATLLETDEENHTATIVLRAREAKGQGTATATITNRLGPHDGGTRVTAETDLQITGPQAQFGRGILEDVANRMLAEFASRLEQRMADDETGGPAADTAPSQQPSSAARPAAAAADDDDALDLGAVLLGPAKQRVVKAGAVAIALVLLVRLLRRR